MQHAHHIHQNNAKEIKAVIPFVFYTTPSFIPSNNPYPFIGSMHSLAGLMEPEAVLGAMNMVRWNRPSCGREKPEISRPGRRLEISAIFIRVPTPSANIGTPPNFFHYTAVDRRRQHHLAQPLNASLF